MSPLTFLARPARWLRAIHRHRGTLSGAPNFAFDLCTRRIADEDLEGLDLSSWRMAFNGAEPVLPDTLDAFAGRFAPLRLRAPRPRPRVRPRGGDPRGRVHSRRAGGPLVERVERDALERERRAVPAEATDENALTTISSGVPIPGFEVRTVDDGGRETPERTEGRLQFRGPSTTSGYYRDRAATAALFDGEWLESGDLAYIAGGELFVTGRVKDVVIRAGRNLYPYDYELAAGDTDGVRRGCVALFAARARGGAAAGTERLVAVAETRETDPGRQAGIRADLERLAEERLGQPLDEVVLAPPHTVLKTSLERQDPASGDGGALRVRGARRPAGGVKAALAAARAPRGRRRRSRPAKVGGPVRRDRLGGMGVGGARARGDGSGPRRNRRPPAALRLRLRAGRRPCRLPARRGPGDRRGGRAPPAGRGVRHGLEPHELP